MKRNFCIILLCIPFMLTGCFTSVNKSTLSQSPTQSHIFEKPNPKLTYDTSNAEETEEELSNTYGEDARKQLSELYNTSQVFEDLYMVEKVWLIGKENVVQLISFGDYDDICVLSRDNIEKIKISSFSDFAKMTVYDKTGQSISLTVHSDEFFELSELFNHLND